MNAHNKENDPFEDVFRDRFADFESEPDTQLWQKIEPKLPVDSTRKFPYWQISTGIILLLLTGLWIYRENLEDDNQAENIINSVNNRTEKPLLSGSQQITIPNKPLTVSDLTKRKTNNVEIKLTEKLTIKEPAFESVVGTAEIHRQILVIEKGNNIDEARKNDNEKTLLFSESNTTIKFPDASLEKENRLLTEEKNNFLITNKIALNLFPLNKSNEKQGVIADDLSNKVNTSNVLVSKESISVLNKNFLTTLDAKSYSLLRNHFKTPRIKFVVAPKKDDYYKERKPLEIYASVMPLLNYYTITPNGNDANYVHSISVNNDEDRLGFYTQAGLVFTLSDRFKLRTGLTFTRTNHSIGYQIRTDSLIIQPSDRQGVDVSFEEKKANYSQIAHYLGTKIDVQYTFLKGEALSHYVNIGLEGAYRLNGVKQVNGFANFAYGVTRQIGDNAFLFVEPTFSYSLNQQSDNNSFLLIKPNKIGFNIGVNFKIK